MTVPVPSVLRVVNVALANKLFKAGIELLSPEVLDGNRVFVFAPKAGQEAIIRSVLYGKN